MQDEDIFSRCTLCNCDNYITIPGNSLKEIKDSMIKDLIPPTVSAVPEYDDDYEDEPNGFDDDFDDYEDDYEPVIESLWKTFDGGT